MENGDGPLLTIWQEFELMFRKSGLLHHKNYCRHTILSAMLANNFSTSTCFAIFELVKFMCFDSPFSYRTKNFHPVPILQMRVPATRAG